MIVKVPGTLLKALGDSQGTGNPLGIPERGSRLGVVTEPLGRGGRELSLANAESIVETVVLIEDGKLCPERPPRSWPYMLIENQTGFSKAKVRDRTSVLAESLTQTLLQGFRAAVNLGRTDWEQKGIDLILRLWRPSCRFSLWCWPGWPKYTLGSEVRKWP